MKKTIIVVIVLLSGLFYNTASAQLRVITVPQGGTGAATLSGCLQGNGEGAITGTGVACGSGGGGSAGSTWSTTTSSVAGQLINYPNNTTDIVNIGSTATTTGKFWFDPNTGASNFAETTATSTIAGKLKLGNTGTMPQIIGWDEDTGIHFDGPDIMSLHTGGVQRLLINASGFVGVGTSSPLQELTVQGDIRLETTRSNDTGVIYKDGNTFIHNFSHPTGSTAIPEGRNTFVGLGAGNFTMGSTATLTSQASRNTAFGVNSFVLNTTGYQNDAFGFETLYNNTTGYKNVSIGTQSLRVNQTGYQNVAVGGEALRNATSSTLNVAVGASSLPNSAPDGQNTAVGYLSMGASTFSYHNVAVGASSFQSMTTGAGNTGVGQDVGKSLNGDYNTLYGEDALLNATTGNRNTVLGAESGWIITGGSDNILIGYGVNATSSSSTNFLNIGSTIYGDLSSKKIGIATSTPTESLQVNTLTATSTIAATVVNGSTRSTTLGGRIVLQDTTGGTCTEITTQAGVMSSKAVTCP